MVTIIPRAEERLQVRPLADVRREERAPNTGGVVAESQYKLGQAVAKEAMSFGELAIRKQEQVDRIELAKIKALRDSELQTVLLEEERNPDYEGMGDRITSRMKKYDDDLRKGVNGRLLKYVDPMIETEGAKLVPVLQGMYLKKQDDHASATALEAINQFIQNKDWDSAIATVDGMSWLDESKRAELKINIENKRQAHELAANAQAFAGDMLKKHGVDGLSSAIAEAREAYKGKDEDVYLGYVNSLYSDVRAAQHAELESAKIEVQKALYGGASHSKVAGVIASYSEKFKGYGTQGEAWALGLKVDNDRVHGTGIFAPKPSEALTRLPLTRAEAVRQLVHFNPEFANLPKDEQERLVRKRLGISEEQHSAYFTQLGEAKLRGMSNEHLNKAAAMGYITYDEVRQIVEYDKKISPGNKDYLKTKEKNMDLFLKTHGGSIFGGTQNPARNTAIFYFREESRKLDPAAPDFYKQADEAGRRAMLRAIEEKHKSGMPLIDEGWIWDSDTELGTLKKSVDGLKIKDIARDVPPRPWGMPPQNNNTDNLPETKKDVQDELDELLESNPPAD